MTAKQMSADMNIPYRDVLKFLATGHISAKKEKGKWVIDDGDYDEWARENTEKVQILKAEYVGLYWQGLNPDRIQKRVKGDFEKRAIVGNSRGFAEITIYESVMEAQR